MAHFRRLVAEALSGLQGSSEAARVIDLGTADAPAAPRGSARSNAAAGSVPADDLDASAPDVEKHWSALEIGAWLLKHRADDPVLNVWDWYVRVRKAINRLVGEGILHMGRLDRFRLADDAPAALTYTVIVRWNDEDIPVEVASNCTDARLRDAVSKKTGGRLHPSKMRLWYPLSDELATRPVDGPLSDLGVGEGSIVRLEIVPRADGDTPDGAAKSPVKRDDDDDDDAIRPAARAEAGAAAASSDPLDAHEVIELEAEGEGGWNDDGDGWVNLVRDDDDAATKDADARAAKTTTTTKTKSTPPVIVFDSDDEADDAAALDPKAATTRFSPAAAARSNPRAGMDSESELADDGPCAVDDDDGGGASELSGGATDADTDTDDEAEARAVLHAQVASFAAKAGSDDADLRRRESVCAKMRAAIVRAFPSARLEVFGSGATGLALKDADIDLVVLGVGPVASATGGGFGRADRSELVAVLRKIEKILCRERLVQRAQGIYTAKVPIIKMHTGAYAVDLSVGAANGLAAVEWIREQVRAFPPLRPLVLVLKRLLKTHALDDASTGGCGGYLLVSLAVSHLRACGDEAKSQGADLGALLIGFLRRYGRDFDYARTAVAAGRASGVMRASDLPAAPGPFGRRPMVLAEDPQETGRNITAAAYRFREVKALFHAAGEAMSAEGELTFLPEMAAVATRPAWHGGGGGGVGVGFDGGRAFDRDDVFAMHRTVEAGTRRNPTWQRQPATAGAPAGAGASANAAGKGGGGKAKGKNRSGAQKRKARGGGSAAAAAAAGSSGKRQKAGGGGKWKGGAGARKAAKGGGGRGGWNG